MYGKLSVFMSNAFYIMARILRKVKKALSKNIYGKYIYKHCIGRRHHQLLFMYTHLLLNSSATKTL